MSLEKFQFLHRLSGFLVLVFVLFFAVTGIVLNHADDLGMDEKYLGYNWLLDWYQISPSSALVSYQAGNAWLSWLDTRLYFNADELPVRTDALLGAIELDGVIIAALQDELLLLSDAGVVIEKVSEVNGLPEGMHKIGKVNDDLFIIAAAAGYYTGNRELTYWRPDQSGTGSWSAAGPLPADVANRIMSSYRGPGLSMERFMLDLHSGRLLGRWRAIIVDLAALLLIISAISGVWMWYKKKKMLAGI